MNKNQLTPVEIVKELDNYVIGQDDAKRSVAIALRNRWRRLKAKKPMRDEIMPNNIIMIGPTGVGKTEIARRLATLAQSPFIKVEASKFTEVGYVGRDVESIIRDLMLMSIELVTKEHEQLLENGAPEIVEERYMDLLMPEEGSIGMTCVEKIIFNANRKKLLDRVKNHEFDDVNIGILVESTAKPPTDGVQMLSGTDPMDALMNMLKKAGKRESKHKTMKIGDMKEIIVKEEVGAMLDEDKIVEEAVSRVQTEGIVFIDEIDKIVGNHNHSGIDVSREGVQRDLLPIVEGSTVKTKYGFIKTDHILFIASGAFHVSKPSDMIPELQGRFPIRVELKNLTTEDFVKILTTPENALLKQYKALLATEDVDLKFTDGAIQKMAEYATSANDKTNNIGARRLHTIMTQILDDIMFNAPSGEQVIKIDSAHVDKALKGLIKNEDLSRYIL